jgi:hypothetical protein
VKCARNRLAVSCLPLMLPYTNPTPALTAGLERKPAFPSRWRAPGSIAGALRGVRVRRIRYPAPEIKGIGDARPLMAGGKLCDVRTTSNDFGQTARRWNLAEYWESAGIPSGFAKAGRGRPPAADEMRLARRPSTTRMRRASNRPVLFACHFRRQVGFANRVVAKSFQVRMTRWRAPSRQS